MWFWRIIKEVLYNLFVEVWYVGLTALTLFAFYAIMLFISIVKQGPDFIVCIAFLIFAAGGIYIVYWYFANHHYILGAVSILICLAVLYITCIEPYIEPDVIEETFENVAALAGNGAKKMSMI